MDGGGRRVIHMIFHYHAAFDTCRDIMNLLLHNQSRTLEGNPNKLSYSGIDNSIPSITLSSSLEFVRCLAVGRDMAAVSIEGISQCLPQAPD